MIRFVHVFWSILWRSILVLALNSGIAYTLYTADHSLFEVTANSIKIRHSLTYLPAAVMFAVLAMQIKGTQNMLLEERSPLSNRQWRQTYFGLSACAFGIVIIFCISAVILNIDTWVSIQKLLPLPLFMLFWIAVAIWQAKSR